MQTEKSRCFSIDKARKIQLELAKQVILEDKLPSTIRLVGGVDVAYTSERSIGAAEVLEYDSLKIVESRVKTLRACFPYIPTLLSFREIPPAIAAIKALHLRPSVILVDGQGYAHPYRCGFASHLGIKLKTATIGVAKSRLIGVPVPTKGSDVRNDIEAWLVDKGEVIGALVRTKKDAKPLYVSVGHMVSLPTAIKIVKKCTRNERIPEPLRAAHILATKRKKQKKQIL